MMCIFNFHHLYQAYCLFVFLFKENCWLRSTRSSSCCYWFYLLIAFFTISTVYFNIKIHLEYALFYWTICQQQRTFTQHCHHLECGRLIIPLIAGHRRMQKKHDLFFVKWVKYKESKGDFKAIAEGQIG